MQVKNLFCITAYISMYIQCIDFRFSIIFLLYIVSDIWLKTLHIACKKQSRVIGIFQGSFYFFADIRANLMKMHPNTKNFFKSTHKILDTFKTFLNSIIIVLYTQLLAY